MQQSLSLSRRVNWPRVFVGGLAAGLLTNLFDYVAHRVILADAWAAAFHALGKAPAGWWAVVPANFGVGVLMVWLFAQLRSRYGRGFVSALKAGMAIWFVFWVIPMAAWMPMHLFPNRLLAAVIAVGLVEVNLGALLGGWLYKDLS